MLRVLVIALASTALTTGAFATEAFIGQVGKGNAGQNIQLNQSQTSTSTAVIYQANNSFTSNGHDALQVQLGDNDYAYTYQTSAILDHIALTWQDGTGDSSVNVQTTHDNNSSCNDTSCLPSGSQDARFKARTIQLGDNNTAVNWQSDQGGGHGLVTLSPTDPTLNLSGDTIPVNGNAITLAAYNFNTSVPAHF
jgi:hypothetical protein